MPFPTTAYITNNFYVVAGPVSEPMCRGSYSYLITLHRSQIFPFIFSFSFLYPAARLIRDIVSEKELRIREVMRAMGLPTGTLMASWFVTYILITLSQAIVITGITSQNIFKVCFIVYTGYARLIMFR